MTNERHHSGLITEPPRPHWPAPAETREAAVARQDALLEGFFGSASDYLHRRQRAKRPGALPAGRPPRILVTGAQGTGKTTAALRGALSCLAWEDARVIWFLAPTHAKADEARRDITELAQAEGVVVPTSLVLRGRGAARPDGSAEAMCRRAELAAAVAARGLPVGQTLCRRQTVDGDRADVCPFFDGCPYVAQRAEMDALDRGIVCMAHDYAFLGAPGRKPDLVIIDESLSSRAAWSRRVGLDAVLTGPEGADETYLRVGRALAAALPHPDNLARLRQTVTVEEMEAALADLQARRRPANERIVPGMDDGEIRRLLAEQRRDDGHALASLLEEAYAEFGQPFDGFRNLWTQSQSAGAEGMRTWACFGGLRDVKLDDDVPLLLLDGTGDPWFTGRLFGKGIVRHHIPVPRDAEVVQVAGKSFSRQSLTGCDRHGVPLSDRKHAEAARLRAEVLDLARRQPGPVFVAGNKAVVNALTADGLPGGVSVGHFGALRGRNEWETCRTVLLVGREEPPAAAMEAQLRPWLRPDDGPLISGEYRKEPRAIRIASGTAWSDVRVHPDARVQRMLEQVREAEQVQAIDRVRPIFNRRTILLLTDLVLDVTVDRVMRWQHLRAGGTVFQRIWDTTGVLLTSPADLAAAHPDFFPSAAAAKKAVQRAVQQGLAKGDKTPIESLLAFCPPFVTVRYRVPGVPGRAKAAYISTRHPDPGAALTAVVGSVVGLEEVP